MSNLNQLQLNLLWYSSIKDKSAVVQIQQHLNNESWLNVQSNLEDLLDRQNLSNSLHSILPKFDVLLFCISHNSISNTDYYHLLPDFEMILEVVNNMINPIPIVVIKLESLILPWPLPRWHQVEYYKEYGLDYLLADLYMRMYNRVANRSGPASLSLDFNKMVYKLQLLSPYLKWNCLNTLSEHDAPVSKIIVSSNEQYFVTASFDGLIKVWNLTSKKLLYTLTSHERTVRHLIITNDNEYLISGSDDDTLKIWSLVTGALLQTLNCGNAISTLSYIPDRQLIISGYFVTTGIDVWRITNNKNKPVHKDFDDIVINTKIANNLPVLITGSVEGILKIWDLSNDLLMHNFVAHANRINGLAFSKTNNFIVSASIRDNIKIWDTKTGNLIRKLPYYEDSIEYIVINNDDILAIVAHGLIEVWNLRDPNSNLLYSLQAHRDSINGFTLTLDNAHAISAGADKTIKIWELATGDLVRTLEGHKRAVTSIALALNSGYLISGAGDGIIKIWGIK